jgi:hypothetical protein
MRPSVIPLTPPAYILIVRPLTAPVAQLDRVPGYEPGGRTFESCQARHLNKKPTLAVGFFVQAGGFGRVERVRSTNSPPGRIWTEPQASPQGQNSPKAVLSPSCHRSPQRPLQHIRKSGFLGIEPIVPGAPKSSRSVPERRPPETSFTEYTGHIVYTSGTKGFEAGSTRPTSSS